MKLNKMRQGGGWVSAAVVLATVLASPSARAFDLAAVGVLNLATSGVDPKPALPTEAGGKLGFGFGGLITFGYVPMVGLQAGALYVPRKLTFETPVSTTTVTSTWLQIPVTVRVSPIDLISIGVGAYYALALGDITTAIEPVIGPTVETSSSYEASSAKGSDFGLIGSVALKLPLLPTLAILADARYVFGLTDLNTTDTTTDKTRDLQLLVGLNFGF